MRDTFLVLIVIGSVPIIFIRPYVGILMWSWIAYFVPQKLAWGFAYDLPIAQAVAVATLLGWLMSREPKTIPWNTVSILIAALTIWISVTTLFAVLPDAAFDIWVRAIKIIFMTYVTISMLYTRQRIELLLWVIVLSLAAYGIRGGLYVLGGGTGLVWGPPGGFFEDNNALALALVMVIPLFRYFQLQLKSMWAWLAFGAAMALSFGAIVGTFSRGGMLGAAAMLFALTISVRQRALLFSLAAIGIIVALPFVPDRWIGRMETIQTYERDESAAGRIQAWSFGWKLALDRPLVGGGFKVYEDSALYLSYIPEAESARAFHSNYFEILGSHGFVGVGIFLGLMFAAFLWTGATIRAAKGREELKWASDLAATCRASLVGYAVCGAFLSLAFFDLYYHLLSIIMCTRLIVAREINRGDETVPQPAASQHRLGF